MKEGLYRKYRLSKVDGSDIDEKAKYFVVRYDQYADHGEQGREALIAYCRSIFELKIESLYPLFDDLIMDIISNCSIGSVLHCQACNLLAGMSEIRMLDSFNVERILNKDI